MTDDMTKHQWPTPSAKEPPLETRKLIRQNEERGERSSPKHPSQNNDKWQQGEQDKYSVLPRKQSNSTSRKADAFTAISKGIPPGNVQTRTKSGTSLVSHKKRDSNILKQGNASAVKDQDISAENAQKETRPMANDTSQRKRSNSALKRDDALLVTSGGTLTEGAQIET